MIPIHPLVIHAAQQVVDANRRYNATEMHQKVEELVSCSLLVLGSPRLDRDPPPKVVLTTAEVKYLHDAVVANGGVEATGDPVFTIEKLTGISDRFALVRFLGQREVVLFNYASVGMPRWSSITNAYVRDLIADPRLKAYHTPEPEVKLQASTPVAALTSLLKTVPRHHPVLVEASKEYLKKVAVFEMAQPADTRYTGEFPGEIVVLDSPYYTIERSLTKLCGERVLTQHNMISAKAPLINQWGFLPSR